MKFVAFFVGMYEFRRSWTTSYEDYDLRDAYDRGRDFAHRMTLRRFDHG